MAEEPRAPQDALAELGSHLSAAGVWEGEGSPRAHEVMALLPRYEAAREELAREAARGDSPRRRALEAAVLRARLALGRPRPTSLARAAHDAAAAATPSLVRSRFFVGVALLALGASFLVGYLALEHDSRLGDLLLAGRAAGEGPLGDPLGGLLETTLGPRAGGALATPGARLLLLYGLFAGGLGLGLVPLVALALAGLRAGVACSVAAAGSGAATWTALLGASPDFVALALAAAAGLVVAHRALAPGRLPRAASLAQGLRDGALLWLLAVAAHGVMAVPSDTARLVGAAGVLFFALTGLGAPCERS